MNNGIKLKNGSTIDFPVKPTEELTCMSGFGYTYMIGYGWLEQGKESDEHQDLKAPKG